MYRVHHLSDSEQMCGKSLQWFEITCLLMLQIMGCGLLGVGIWLLVTDFSAREITVIINSDMFEIGTYMILAGGGLVALLAFCGCCGTMREDRCILGFVSISEWYMVTVNLTFHLLQTLKQNEPLALWVIKLPCLVFEAAKCMREGDVVTRKSGDKDHVSSYSSGNGALKHVNWSNGDIRYLPARTKAVSAFGWLQDWLSPPLLEREREKSAFYCYPWPINNFHWK